MKSLRLVLIQPDWCLYKNRKFEHRERYQGYVHTKEKSREDPERRWLSAARERSLRRNPNYDTLILAF